MRDALEYGNRSLQAETGPPAPGAPPTDEDCLYLNVTAPAGASGRPVLFWLHGGGYETGDATQAVGDGVAFGAVTRWSSSRSTTGSARQTGRHVPGESPTGAAGLHDQIAALRVDEGAASPPSAATRTRSPSTACRRAASRSPTCSRRRSPAGLIARAAESSGGDHVKDAAQAEALTGRFLRELGADSRAAPVRARGRHPERPARRRADAAVDLDLAAVRRRRRADRQSADRDRGRLGGRGAAAAADLRPRVRPVRAARPRMRRPRRSGC